MSRTGNAGRIAAAVAAVAAAGWAAAYGIDFFVYYHAANVYFHSDLSIYGEEAGFVWPMWYRYPPFFLFLVGPLLILPLRAAAFVWAAGKIAVLAVLGRRLAARIGADWRWIAFLTAPYVLSELRFGNAQFYVFAATLGAVLLARQRPGAAAGLLGGAIAVKIWPAFFVPYLAARRYWMASLGAAAVAVCLTLLPAAVMGIGPHGDDLAVWYAQETEIASDGGSMWFPSQSLLGVLTRALSEIDYSSMPDPNYPAVNWAALPAETVRGIWLASAAAAYLCVLWAAARRPDSLLVDGAAFAALLLLQPYSQRQIALTVLLFPAAAASAARLGVKGRWMLWAAGALVWVQVVIPVSSFQRTLQAIGLDAAAILLLLVFLILWELRDSSREKPAETAA